jgi:multidrug efflux pump subunit AcrA (membrane-fusion protein)
MKISKLMTMTNGRRRFVSLALVTVLILAAVLFFTMRGAGLQNPETTLYRMRKMDLSIIVTEEGVLQAMESEKIVADIDSEAKILSIVDEGQYVKEGTKLVELDSSGIKARLETLELELISSKADMQIAEEEVKKYLQGEHPQKLKELSFAVEKAKAKWEKAKDEMPRETNSGIYSASEIRDAKIAVEEARMNHEKAVLDETIYKEYTHKKDLLEKNTKADTARQKHESKLQQKKDLIEQLGKMVLNAPCDGLVIYGGEGGGRSRWRDDDEQIRVGSVIYKGQVIITLPNVSKMQARARIHEVDIHKIDEEQRVNIKIDAFPEMRLTGQVKTIGALAHDRDWRTRGVKVFDVTIDIDGQHEKLRPGMTAKVDIHVKTVKGKLAMPIEVVFEDPEANEKYCFVRENGKPTKRVVTLGDSDENFVVVEEGLKEGDLVYQYDVGEELNL